MKKVISILLTLVLALTMVVALGACGKTNEEPDVEGPKVDEVALVSKTANGITIDVPSDFGEFTDYSGSMIAMSEDSSNITISARLDAQGGVPTAYDEEVYQQTQIPTFTEVQFVEFSNNVAVDGVPAVFAHFTATNSSSVKIEMYTFILFFEDGTYQTIATATGVGAQSSLALNIQAIVASIKLAK